MSVGRIAEGWEPNADKAASRARWAKWEALHGGFAPAKRHPRGDTAKLRDKLINLPGGRSTGFATKDGYSMRPYYAPGPGNKKVGTTIYGYDINAPNGARLSGVVGLRNTTTQGVIDKHRKSHAPTPEAGAGVEKIAAAYGMPTVFPLGDGAVLAHAGTEGGDRFWHVSADGTPMPVHGGVEAAAQYVPVLPELLRAGEKK